MEETIKTPNANIPESNSQRKKKRQRANKKRKFNNSDYDYRRYDKNIQTEDEVKVSLPLDKKIPSNLLLKMFKECQQAKFLNNKASGSAVLIRYDQSILSKKVEELREARIEGDALRINEDFRELLKRAIYLKDEADQANVGKFYKPLSIERFINRKGMPTNLYVLTFETKEEAVAATEKKFELGDKSLTLLPFYTRNDMEEGMTPSRTQPSKNAQVKRKAEKESDNEEEEGKDDDEDDDDDGE